MASKAPPIPHDQRSGLGRGAHVDDLPGDTSHDPAGGTARLNLKEQGRSGNLRQNLTPHARQQDR